MTTLLVLSDRRFVWLSSLIIQGCFLLTAVSPSEAQTTPLQERYIAAVSELGCNVVRFGGSSSDTKRERANLKSLRRHGFDVDTYIKAALEFDEDIRTQSRIASSLTRCEGVNDFLEGVYEGSHQDKEITAQYNFRVRGGRLVGRLSGDVGGAPFKISVNFGRVNSPYVSIDGSQPGFDGYGYRLELSQKDPRQVVGEFVINFEGGGLHVIPITAQRDG